MLNFLLRPPLVFSHRFIKIYLEKITESTALAFREACSLMYGAARLYERKVEYTLNDAADLFDGLSNVFSHSFLSFLFSRFIIKKHQ